MKKIGYLFIIIAVGIFIYTGCSSSSSGPTKTIPDVTAQQYASTAASLNNFLTGIANNSALSGAVVGSGVKAAGLNARTVSGPDGNGWYTITGTATDSAGGLTLDLHAKMTKDASNNITALDYYGSLALTVISGNDTIVFTSTYGSINHPIDFAFTYVNNAPTQVVISGSASLAVSDTAAGSASQDLFSMNIAFGGPFTILTAKGSYPEGTMTCTNIIYMTHAQPDMVITCNKTATATVTMGGVPIAGGITLSPVK